MKIMAVCGQGLGSSLLIEMNIKAALDEIGRMDIEAAHTNINSFDGSDEEIIAVICGSDLEDSIDFDKKIVLDNLLDKDEVASKIEEFLKENNI